MEKLSKTMKTFNPILDAGQCRYDARPELAIQMDKKIKRKKIPKTKLSKQKKMSYTKINPKAFMSLIDTSYEKSPESSVEVVKMRNTYGFLLSAENDLKELIELAKIASGEDDLVMADFFYELMELKQKELELIYNYRANKRN